MLNLLARLVVYFLKDNKTNLNLTEAELNSMTIASADSDNLEVKEPILLNALQYIP
ncbi:MAG: hypothetical protein ABJK64_12620 [Paraglaciecola sp.]|uniref:hypothetical protein n=1 Tax=Paraglaciecola sp. TaxID=1920173 RepID=UPI00329835E6